MSAHVNFLKLPKTIYHLKCSKRPAMVTDSYNPSTQMADAERSQVLGQHGLYSKTLSKKNGAMAQTVARLPNKCEALSSNPNTAKKKCSNKMFLWKIQNVYLNIKYYTKPSFK
jgi:hypothetical protein